jgi:hypothetical protein
MKMATQRLGITLNATDFKQGFLPQWTFADNISSTSWRGQMARDRKTLLGVLQPLHEMNEQVRLARAAKKPDPFFGEVSVRAHRQRENAKTIAAIEAQNKMRREQIAKERRKIVHFNYTADYAGGPVGRANREEIRRALSRMPESERNALIESNETAQIAVLEQPAWVSGVSAALHTEIERRRLEKLFGPELEEIRAAQSDADKLDEIIAVSRSAVEAALKAVDAEPIEPVAMRASEKWA